MGSKKHRKGTPRPAPIGGQRTEFMRLISIGVSKFEACRRVGVNRQTGTRWRFGRIDGFGAQIAAICGAHHATLATRNVKDFEHTGITLVDPWKPT